MEIFVSFYHEDFERKFSVFVRVSESQYSEKNLPVEVFSNNKFVGEEGVSCCIRSHNFSTKTEAQAWVDYILQQIVDYWREILKQRISLPEDYKLNFQQLLEKY